MGERLNTEPDYRKTKKRLIKEKNVEEFNIFWNQLRKINNHLIKKQIYKKQRRQKTQPNVSRFLKEMKKSKLHKNKKTILLSKKKLHLSSF